MEGIEDRRDGELLLLDESDIAGASLNRKLLSEPSSSEVSSFDDALDDAQEFSCESDLESTRAEEVDD